MSVTLKEYAAMQHREAVASMKDLAVRVLESEGKGQGKAHRGAKLHYQYWKGRSEALQDIVNANVEVMTAAAATPLVARDRQSNRKETTNNEPLQL